MKTYIFILFFIGSCSVFKESPESFIVKNKAAFDIIVTRINNRQDINDSTSWYFGIPENEIHNLGLENFKEYEPFIEYKTHEDNSTYSYALCLYANSMSHDSCYGVWTSMKLCRCLSDTFSTDTVVSGTNTTIPLNKLWKLKISHGI